MKVTTLVAAVSMALSGALLAGCDREGTDASGGGSSASGSGSSGMSGSPGTAPKRPASPGGSTSGSSK